MCLSEYGHGTIPAIPGGRRIVRFSRDLPTCAVGQSLQMNSPCLVAWRAAKQRGVPRVYASTRVATIPVPRSRRSAGWRLMSWMTVMGCPCWANHSAAESSRLRRNEVGLSIAVSAFAPKYGDAEAPPVSGTQSTRILFQNYSCWKRKLVAHTS